MAREYLPLIWWRERDEHGHYWAVILTSDDLHDSIRGNLGITLCGGHTILIWAGQGRDELLDTALHEVAHAHSWANADSINERSISRVVPRIVRTLRRQGWTPPPMPEGWRSLASHARHVRYGRKQREE
jgi:hypothetical protein